MPIPVLLVFNRYFISSSENFLVPNIRQEIACSEWPNICHWSPSLRKGECSLLGFTKKMIFTGACHPCIAIRQVGYSCRRKWTYNLIAQKKDVADNCHNSRVCQGLIIPPALSSLDAVGHPQRRIVEREPACLARLTLILWL